MNNIASNTYLPRWVAPRFRATADEARVTVLTGARQVGKSTLLAHELGAEWQRFSLDDLDVQGQARRDPDVLLSASRRIVLDEAHLIPGLFPRIKRYVDLDRTRRFVLSGSANLLLLARTTESLAGRAEFLHLSPLSAGEMAGKPPPGFIERALAADWQPSGAPGLPMKPGDLAAVVWRGGMPEVVHRRGILSLVRWRDGYVRSYIERDLRQLSQIDSLPDFKRLMGLAALRSGCLLNQSEIARDAGLSQPTAHRYLGLLEVSEHCRRLPSYHSSASQGIVKSPKLMWTDTGIAAFAAGLLSPADLLASREWGAFLETHVLAQLLSICSTWNPPGEVFFWRTRAGQEVDFIIRHGRRMVAIEVKAASRVRFEDTAGLQSFMKANPECRMGIVLYAGGEEVSLSPSLAAIPLSAVLPERSEVPA